MLLLGEQDFAASNHDSFDANSLVMVTLRQATRRWHLVRRAALSSSPPALPTMWPCCERFLRWRSVPLRRGGAAPPASQDGHSRCTVAELRARSHSSPSDVRLSETPRRSEELQMGPT